MIDYEALLHACARGDKAALRTLFEAEVPRLVGVAQRILRRRDLAEEAVQDGFAQIWRRADTFDRTFGSARGWIYAVIRHRALNMLRNGKREELVTSQRLEDLQETSVIKAWEGLDARSELRVRLDELDGNHRKAVLLAYVIGMTHDEIAGHMEAPLGTVKSWLRRALISLRECLT